MIFICSSYLKRSAIKALSFIAAATHITKPTKKTSMIQYKIKAIFIVFYKGQEEYYNLHDNFQETKGQFHVWN